MRRIFRFTREKFLALPVKQQHKKCTEFLRPILEENHGPTHYNELASWLELAALPVDRKGALDRFYYHLALSETKINEGAIFITTQDNEEAAKFLPIAIYLDHLRSSQNVGSIIRTVEAFRLGKVVFSENMCTASHPQVQKCSMGAYEWVEYGGELPRPIIALETVPSAPCYYDFAFPDSFTLVLGNEEYGCSDAMLARADAFIKIPLFGRKNSLNVAAAFAIVAAEIARQKQKTFKD
jgi:tRNA G18 (ribose-2'-O)-methylase SpoU